MTRPTDKAEIDISIQSEPWPEEDLALFRKIMKEQKGRQEDKKDAKRPFKNTSAKEKI